MVEYVLALGPAVQPHQLFGTVKPVVADSRLHVKGVGVIGVKKATYAQDWFPVGVAVGGRRQLHHNCNRLGWSRQGCL